MKRILKIIGIIVLLLAIVFTVGFFIYTSDYSHSTISLADFVDQDPNIKLTEKEDGYLIQNNSSNRSTMIVFYPGAKIEPSSYLSLLDQLAEKGFDSYIVKMPYNLAIFKIYAFNRIYDNYDYEHWYLMGHSLGGAMASYFASTNYSRLDGLILLAAYSTEDLTETNLPVLSIYGSNDGVLNIDTYNKSKKNLPSTAKEVVIEGGNHAYFGNYEDQKNEEATISREDQQSQTVEAVTEFINENN